MLGSEQYFAYHCIKACRKFYFCQLYNILQVSATWWISREKPIGWNVMLSKYHLFSELLTIQQSY